MLVKFESKSARVKGLSFHVKRPWLLATLYTGTIQLWDYRLCTLIEKFDDHEGPVRGIHFHQDQPLFVSGGDDTHIKVWNFQKTRCLFTLTGHMDYVRSTFFHPENPWIVSASDDNTIRIWNWQSRACLTTVTGHNHYVMCAQFHPTMPLLVSCSLDQTVRLWDLTGLVNKFYTPSNMKDNSNKLSAIEVLAPIDVVVKCVLEGHDRGVNWVSFHPTQNLITSSSDDRLVKIWRFSETGAFEIDTIRGHYNNVCCSVFSRTADTIISVSEDKSIRVWDANKHNYLSTYRRENDRFWAVAVCPSSNIIAAGHDNGIILFKLNREKPAFDLYNNQILYIKDRFLKKFDPTHMKDSVVAELKRSHSRHKPVCLFYNPVDNMILLNYSCRSEGADSHFIDLISVPSNLKPSDEIIDSLRHSSISSVWVSRNRIASVDSNYTLSIRNTSHVLLNNLEFGKCQAVFYAGTGFVLAQLDEKVSLIDVKDNFIVKTVVFPGTRSVHWSSDFTRVALISKKDILVCTKGLEILATYSEVISVKSCTFVSDNSSILLYTTPCHIKYILLPWGDQGIVRTLDVLLYLVHAKGKNISCLDRDIKPRILTIDNTEYLFKLAILQQRYEEVLSIIRSSNLIGQSLISFVREKGLPEIALHFIKDKKTRFLLSLECSNLEISLEMAKILDHPKYWEKLASLSLKLGNIECAEECYIRLKNYHSLLFLYIITGNMEKLEKLPKIDTNMDSKITSLMCIGDIQGLVKTFSSLNEHSVAYAMAGSHSLPQVAEEIKSNFLSDVQLNVPDTHEVLAHRPATPQNTLSTFWPKLTTSKSIFDIISDSRMGAHGSGQLTSGIPEALFDNPNDIWNEDIADESKETVNSHSGEEVEETEQNDAWVISDDEISVDVDIDSDFDHDSVTEISLDSKPLYPSEWTLTDIPIFHIMTGAFPLAFKILKAKFGVINFVPLKSIFLSAYLHTKLLIPSFLPSQNLLGYPCSSSQAVDMVPINLFQVHELAQTGFQLTTSGKFSEALSIFLAALYKCMLVVVGDKKQLADLQSIFKICKEYVVGLSIELERRSLQNNPTRAAELAAYFTQCDLQPSHTVLVLRIAMNLFYKLKNYKTSGVMARRLLDLAPPADICTQARKVLAASEKYGLTNQVKVQYDEYNPFDICCGSFTPIYSGDQKITCSFCNSTYQPSFSNTVCTICKIGEIGVHTPGFSTQKISLT